MAKVEKIKLKRRPNKSLRCNIFLRFHFVRLKQNIIKLKQGFIFTKDNNVKIK